MDDSIWGFIGVIVGAIIGASASIVTTILSSNNAVRLQQGADSQERMERARAFQRETLISVQDCFNDALHLMMKIYLTDVDDNNKGAVWRKSPLNKDIDEKHRDINRNLLILSERIADDSLREELSLLQSNILKAYLAPSRKEAETLVMSVCNQSDPFLKHVGSVLRSLY